MPKGNLEHDNTTNAPVHDQLKALITRIESVNEEIGALQDDRKEIFAEAKAFGLDLVPLRQVIALRRIDEAKRLEAEALLDTYKRGVGLATQAEMEL